MDLSSAPWLERLEASSTPPVPELAVGGAVISGWLRDAARAENSPPTRVRCAANASALAAAFVLARAGWRVREPETHWPQALALACRRVGAPRKACVLLAELGAADPEVQLRLTDEDAQAALAAAQQLVRALLDSLGSDTAAR